MAGNATGGGRGPEELFYGSDELGVPSRKMTYPAERPYPAGLLEPEETSGEEGFRPDHIILTSEERRARDAIRWRKSCLVAAVAFAIMCLFIILVTFISQ